ncbi:uncharacterized protein M6B38_241190 [Iris pallida]|uniref:Uncharacterized protein n=1 Tax=Iris pallida TaxID=29817 RepID=A0AAX6DJ39_IRIPA|nr:uncharacterized protein M6B38_241190 [Iris pallida]
MEVVLPMKDLHLDSTTSTPYTSAPTSPRRFGSGGGEPFNYYCHYTSAPASPTRVAALYAASVVPFDWEEEASGARKTQPGGGNEDEADYKIGDDDFAFEFSGQLEKGVLPPELAAADELFEEGRIRPLKPPPRLYNLDVNDKAPPPEASQGWTVVSAPEEQARRPLPCRGERGGDERER